MNAIQRWFFIDTGEDYHPLGYLPQDGDKELWCKAKDVETLERLIENQSRLHAGIRESMQKRIEFLQDIAMRDDVERRRYQERIGQLENALQHASGRLDLLMSRKPSPV